MRILDLFAGVGGFSWGFRHVFPHADFVPYENDARCIDTYNVNFNTDHTTSDVSAVKAFPKADIVIGGPPCQGFSNANTRKRDGDRKNSLFWDFLRCVKTSGARAFVVENVPGFNKCIPEIVEWGADNGFIVTPHLFKMSDYGVATNRRRYLIVGAKGLKRWICWHRPPQCKFIPTVRWAIGDMPDPSETRSTETINWHSFSDTPAQRYRASLVPKSGGGVRHKPHVCIIALAERKCS